MHVNVPDIPSPDLGGAVHDMLQLADAAASAVSSAAHIVPGLDDPRDAARRRRRLLTIGAVAAVLILLALLRRARSSDTPATNH